MKKSKLNTVNQHVGNVSFQLPSQGMVSWLLRIAFHAEINSFKYTASASEKWV